MERTSYVYILASDRYGTLYIGVTTNLMARVWQHRSSATDGFTKQHHVRRLVWFDTCSDIREAIQREKQLKKWNRAWKVKLISTLNPTWRDLYLDFTA